MTPEQFWFEDMYYYQAYAEAYYNRLNLEAWTFGGRVLEAVGVVLSSGFGSGEAKYSDVPKPNKINQTQRINPKENQEAEYRKKVLACY